MIISVASGKGGTGKTTVAVNLALSVSEHRSKVIRFLDCDVEEPNADIFLKPDYTATEPVCIPVPEIIQEKCSYCGKCQEVCMYHAIIVFSQMKNALVFPELCHGCGGCSLLCPEKAIIEKGLEIGMVQAGKAGNIDFISGKLNIGKAMSPPVIRAVKNRAQDISAQVHKSKSAQEIIIIDEKENIKVLMKITFDRKIAEAYSKGIPLVERVPEYRDKFMEMLGKIREIKTNAGKRNISGIFNHIASLACPKSYFKKSLSISCPNSTRYLALHK